MTTKLTKCSSHELNCHTHARMRAHWSDSLLNSQTRLVSLNLCCIILGQNGKNYMSPYGSMFKPVAYGNSGCPGTKPGGHGGGVIFINVGDHFYLDGLVEAAGQSADADSNAGGGSGGSILISAGRFSGHGMIRVDGGAGNGASGGGGAGGRIAVHTVTDKIAFIGQYSATGQYN